jgi:hypothetical protein
MQLDEKEWTVTGGDENWCYFILQFARGKMAMQVKATSKSLFHKCKDFARGWDRGKSALRPSVSFIWTFLCSLGLHSVSFIIIFSFFYFSLVCSSFISFFYNSALSVFRLFHFSIFFIFSFWPCLFSVYFISVSQCIQHRTPLTRCRMSSRPHVSI